MLIEFRVTNHRSIREEQAFTMEASLLEDTDDKRPRTVPGLKDTKLLPVAALYGANASGKTNLLHALAFMRDAVLFSHRHWEPDEGIPRSPFAWGPQRNEPSEFVATFIVNEVKYEYGFVASDREFEEEWLFVWPHGKKQTWFEREQSEFTFGDKLVGENSVIRDLTRPNSLFLSAAVQNSHKQLAPVRQWFRDLQFHNVMHEPITRRLARMAVPNEMTLFDDAVSTLDGVRSLLHHADVGIVDFKITRDNRRASYNNNAVMSSEIEFRHQLDSGTEAWLPFHAESRGTQTLLLMAMPILHTIEQGGILLIDELEASLHPMLAAQIVRLFNDPATNPKNAQLIFTTHDTNLLGTTLGEPLLRRDQVWFTEKNKDGATELYPLTDYKPRKAENLERGYLQGRYGAIPFLGELFKSPEAP